jgi:uncharacterized protein (DUF697 family)
MARKSSELENGADPASTSPEASGGTDTATSREGREATASKLVDRFAMMAGAAGIIPLPFVDLAAVGGIQLQMVRRLSQIYDVPFAENSGKAFLASMAGSMIPTSSGIGAASMLKAIPFVGAVVSAFVVPALAGAATYGIGKAFIQHFASGGTFLDFNPPDYREFIKSQKEMWSSRSKPAETADGDKAAAPQAGVTAS